MSRPVNNLRVTAPPETGSYVVEILIKPPSAKIAARARPVRKTAQIYENPPNSPQKKWHPKKTSYHN